MLEPPNIVSFPLNNKPHKPTKAELIGGWRCFNSWACVAMKPLDRFHTYTGLPESSRA